MTENEAIEELKYDCYDLGKAIPRDTSQGCTFENANWMATKIPTEIIVINAVRHQIVKIKRLRLMKRRRING